MTGRVLALVLAVSLGATGCGGDDDTAAADDTRAETQGVPDFLRFEAEDVRGGDTVVGEDYAGEDLVLWFWAPWCTSCNREAPTVAAVQRERGDEVSFLGMAGLDAKGAMADFVERHGLGGFPHAIDPDGGIWERFGSITRSAFVFVDEDGTTTSTEFGVLGETALHAAIDELLAG